ncbi:hypothetical protein CGLO_11846 [Colletotrichum gloeosporioides Cg-14]|uniref:Uncharacterized protein n=1 Tax=Colletotrichum gloeosporioides (strain Cg-14) TaxID=1237896 RepID=T0LAT6_COLGC|nr:hypothetical protein CGLO_11846 [Colletotrichum gloeosporioides Cg-14]
MPLIIFKALLNVPPPHAPFLEYFE